MSFNYRDIVIENITEFLGVIVDDDLNIYSEEAIHDTCEKSYDRLRNIDYVEAKYFIYDNELVSLTVEKIEESPHSAFMVYNRSSSNDAITSIPIDSILMFMDSQYIYVEWVDGDSKCVTRYNKYGLNKEGENGNQDYELLNIIDGHLIIKMNDDVFIENFDKPELGIRGAEGPLLYSNYKKVYSGFDGINYIEIKDNVIESHSLIPLPFEYSHNPEIDIGEMNMFHKPGINIDHLLRPEYIRDTMPVSDIVPERIIIDSLSQIESE